MNFLDIWKKFRKKETSDFDKRKNNEKSHKLAEKSVSRKKKVKGKCACCFGSKFIGAYVIPILVLKFQLKITVKTSAKARGLLSLCFFVFFTLL